MPNSLTAVLCNHIVDSINPTSSNRRLAFPVVTSLLHLSLIAEASRIHSRQIPRTKHGTLCTVIVGTSTISISISISTCVTRPGPAALVSTELRAQTIITCRLWTSFFDLVVVVDYAFHVVVRSSRRQYSSGRRRGSLIIIYFIWWRTID